MSYTSTPNGLFTYTITGVSDSTELAVIQSAFNKWDSICQIDTSRWGSSYSINVSYSIASLTAGILGGASLQTYNITQGTTYGNIMPYEGTIQLNSLYTATMLADTRTGGKTQYYYVVLHELGHILGIGPFWSSSSPIYAPITSYTDANDSTTKYYYTGTNAFNQYKSYLSTDLSNAVIGLPIEDNGGSGTAQVHPEEGLENEVSSDTRYINGIFHPGINEELMTGWMEGSPTDTPLSRVTLGFLEDMGYIVNYSDAESFSIIYTSMSFSDYRKQNKTISEMKSLGYTDTQILQDGYFNIIDLSLAGYTANQIMSAKISAGNFDMSWNSIVPTDLSYTGMSGGQSGMLYYSPVGRVCYGNRLNFLTERGSAEPLTSAPYNQWTYGEYDPNTHNVYAQNITVDTSTTMKPLTPGAHFIIDPSGNLNIGIHGEAYYSDGMADGYYPYDAWFNTIDTSNGNYISNASGSRGLVYQYNRQNGIRYKSTPQGDLPGNGGDGGVLAAGGNGRIGWIKGLLENGMLGRIGSGEQRNSGVGLDGNKNNTVSHIQFVNGGKEWVIDNSHNSYFCRNGIYYQNSGATGTLAISSNYTSQYSGLWQADPDHSSGLNMGPYHYNKNAMAKGFQMLIENNKFTINGVSQDTIRADVGHQITFLFTDWDKTGYTFSISSTNDGTHGGGSELSTSDGLTAISTSTPGDSTHQGNYYISDDHNEHVRTFTPTTAGTYYYYCPEVAGYGGTIIIDASGTSQDGYYNYHSNSGVNMKVRGTPNYNDTKCIHGTQGMIVRKHGSYGTDQGKVLWYTCWNNENGVNKLNTISISDVTRAYHTSTPTINWTLDIDITTTFTEISNHYGVYLYDSFFDSSDNLILGGSVMTTTQTNSQYTYYSLLMRVAVDDVSGSLRAYKLQQIPNLIQENSTSSHEHGWSSGVRTMFDKNHNYLVATPYNVDASYGVSVYKFDSSFNLDTTYGVDGSFNSIYTPYYKQNTNTGNNFMFGSNGSDSVWSRDNNNAIVGATAYDSTDDSLYIIGAGDNPTTSSADHNFVSIIKLDNTGNYDASFSSIYGAAGQLDIVDVIEKKTGASGTTHDGYTTYFGSSARNSILTPTAAIIRENALFIACSGHTAPYNGIYILKLKLSNTPDVRDLSNINFTLSDFQSSGYTELTELKKIPYPLTDYKTVGYSVENMLSAFSVQETLSAGFSSQEILDSQMESFLQEDFATFDAANKFKESYMKTFLDVSGDIRLDSNYTAIFTALSADVSSNIIRNTLKTNNLINLQDLSINQHLFVQNDISLNKKMFIAGDLSVNGTLQFPDNSLSESDFTEEFGSVSGSNQFNNSNSQIKGALDISGLEFYVAGDITVVDKDFQVEGNTYANNFINDDLDNLIMEDDSLINRLDLSSNAFSVSKIYYDSSYSNIASDFSYNAVPFISDNGKNICYPVHDINGTTNYYNTLYSNNHGTSFIDMATRLEGTAGSTNTKGLLNFYVTENQKYIYGYHDSEGIKRSDNYGYAFTDISMVNVPNSDLSYCLGLSNRNSAFDTTHSNLIASSTSGKHVYLGGFKCYDVNGSNGENDIGHFLIKSSDFGETLNFDLSASAINMVTHKNSDLSFNSMIGSRHVSCSADGKYVICSVHGFTPLDDLNIVSATTSSANWYPVLSRNYGTNWDLLTSETFKDYHLLDNTDLSLNTSNSVNNCVGTAVSKTGKYVACAFNSAASIPKPIMFYLSSDYGKTFDLKANLELDTYDITTDINAVVSPTYDFDFRQASTTSITDSVGGLTATYNGGMSSTVSDGAILDGNDDYITLSSFQFGGTFSFEYYLKVNSYSIWDRFLEVYKSDGNYDGFVFAAYATNGYYTIECIENGGGTHPAVNATIELGVWTHVVCTINGTSVKFYYNGSLSMTATATAAVPNNVRPATYLGMKNLSSGVPLHTPEANIKFFKYWHGTELSAAQVNTLYNNTVTVNDNLSNGLQISLSSNAETISLVSTKSASKVYYSSDYGTSWNTKSIALSNDYAEHYSQISSNSQYLVRNITSSSDGNYYHSKLCKQITPYEKTYYTHMVKDFSNISNGNSSADSSITYSGGILTASDYRLKSNVQQLQDETVDNLQPVKFTFKNSQHETFGLIAHELEENYPFLVDGEKDGSHYQTVNYNGLLGVLVHELQLIRKGLEEYE